MGDIKEIENKGSSKHILVYVGICFIITYLYEYFFVVRFLDSNSEYTIASISSRLAVAMFLPAVSVLLTRLITKEGFSDCKLTFDFKNGKYKYYIFAWVAPAILTTIGIVIYFLLFKNEYSSNMEYIIDVYKKQGISNITPEAMKLTIITQGIAALFLGPVLNCITCFGEEWGWRGYLLWKMTDKFSKPVAIILTGVIWGLWHAPLTIMGHNYGMNYKGYPYLGIFAMCVFCLVLGVFASFVTLKTNSCIPAIIFHGAINSFCSIGIYFTVTGGNPFLGPAPTGIIGGIPFIITAIILMIMMKKDDES